MKKFNEDFGSNKFNIDDFEFYYSNDLGKKKYHFVYKNIEGDIVIGYGSSGSKDVKPYISHLEITKGELEDEELVDLEIFIDGNIDSVLNSNTENFINEDSATGGPAVAGMGAVVSAQPSSLAGSTIGSNWSNGGGTIGSGDVSVPYNPGGGKKMNQKLPISGFRNDLVTKPSKKKPVKQFPTDLNEPEQSFVPQTKVMKFTDFIKADINKPKKIKQ